MCSCGACSSVFDGVFVSVCVFSVCVCFMGDMWGMGMCEMCWRVCVGLLQC